MASPNIPAGIENIIPKLPPVDFSTPLDASTLKGKSVLITGGASGIGLACVEAIASYGALVTIVDLQREAGESAVKDLSSKGYRIQFVQCDVTSYDSQVAAFKSAVEFGRGTLDVVVPCAGIIAQQNIIDMAASTEPSLDTAPPEPGFSGVEVNLKGVYYSVYLALHYFRLPPPTHATPFKKAIVLIASVAGYIGYPFSTTYSMSKFGVRGILYSVRDKAIQAGIRINLVAPFYIKTPMTTTSDDPNLNEHLATFGFAPIERVVEAVLRFSVEQHLATRSAVVMPEGSFDAGDNIYDGYGGVAMQERMGVFMGNLMAKMAAKKSEEKERL